MSILVSFGILAWAEAFPSTAFTWLFLHDLKLSASTITTYYSVSFMPLMWRPLFGWISDTFPIFGYRRIPYLTLFSVIYAATFVWMAFGVWTAPVLFAVGVAQSASASFLNLLTAGFLIDVARQDTRNSVKLQAAANASRWAGTLLAQLCALVVYVHNGGSAGSSRLPIVTTRGAIALTGLAPAVLAVISPLLPEERSLGSCRSACQGLRSYGAASVRVAFAVFAVQANLALIGCRQFMAPGVFRVAATTLGTLTALSLVLMYSCRGRSHSGSGALLHAPVPRTPFTAMQWLRLCLFCFAVNTIPSSSVLLNLYQSVAFTSDYFQSLAIVASLSSIAAALVFGRGLNRRKLITIFLVSTGVSLLVGFLPLPYVQLSLGSEHKQGFSSVVGMLVFAATLLGGLAGMFAVLPVDTLVTTVCGSIGNDCSSIAYAVLVSFYDFGATVGGLAAAPLQQLLGLDGTHWAALPLWVLATATLRLLVLPMLLLLPRLPDTASQHGTSFIVGGSGVFIAEDSNDAGET